MKSCILYSVLLSWVIDLTEGSFNINSLYSNPKELQ